MLTLVGLLKLFFFKIVRLFSKKRDTYDVIAIKEVTRISNTIIKKLIKKTKTIYQMDKILMMLKLENTNFIKIKALF